MTDMKLAVAGAGGRMGQTVIRTIAEIDGVVLCGAFDRAGSEAIGGDAGEIAQIGDTGIVVTDDAVRALGDADAVIDFTAPQATVSLADKTAHAGVIHVIGTTGMTDEHDAAIRRAAERTAIVKSGNMSLGVNLLAVLVRQAARALEAADWDIEIVEMHHRHKVDAPSGTALLLGEAAAAGRGIDLGDASVRVRDGHTGPRPVGAIGFAALRGGSVVGDHSVIIAGEGEQVELTHRATDRAIFARGAIKAALWARNRKSGLYSMLDVLGLSED
jgi:4-hydroxy-tetrahydrodipicolinate reductase